MSILSRVNVLWAILPEKLEAICGICDRLLSERGLGDESAATPVIDNPPANPGYSITPQGIAVISIEGIIVKNTDWLSKFFGEVGTRDIARGLDNADADAAVKAILLQIDSPGGTVDGTQELAAQVFDMRQNGAKPIYAIADGLMASAAVWIGLAAEKVYALTETAMIGSIGVITTHVDLTKRAEMLGIKVTHVTAGKYKAVGSPFKVLDREGEDVLQARVDDLYTIFVDAVAQMRGVTVEKVLSDMADGRVFGAREAVQAGLIDGIATRGQVVNALAARAAELERMRVSRVLRAGLMQERGISI
jgi:signal peptide peptidase SppA